MALPITILLKKIDRILSTLENKIKSVDQHVSPAAHEKAMELLTKLKLSRDDYAQDQTKQSFLTKCNAAIVDGKPILERDLSWENYLANLFKSLANTLIGILSNNQSFFELKRNTSSQAVEEAERDLSDSLLTS